MGVRIGGRRRGEKNLFLAGFGTGRGDRRCEAGRVFLEVDKI